MKFIHIAKGGKVDGLKLSKNIVVTDDMSSVVFVDVGENGEVINLDADGNQVMTPEAYKNKLKHDRKELYVELANFKSKLEEIENEIAKARIKRQLNEVEELASQYDMKSEWKLRQAVTSLKDACKNIGYGVIAGLITSM